MVGVAAEQLADMVQLPVREAELAVERLFRDGAQIRQSTRAPRRPSSPTRDHGSSQVSAPNRPRRSSTFATSSTGTIEAETPSTIAQSCSESA